MNLEELRLNRFGYKAKQSTGTSSSPMLAVNNRGMVPLPADNIKDANDNTKDARNIITGTVITSCFIQTSALPNRVELSGNDARFFDDSSGGTGSINGDTASIRFIRSDKNPGDFIIQKRHGANDDLENVFEMYYSEVAGGGEKNYIFIGRSGIASEDVTFTDQVIINATIDVRTEIAGIFNYNSRPTFYTFDYNTVDPSKEGVITHIAGEGKDGFAGIGKLVEVLTFSSATSFAVGDTITGDSTGATALLIYKISSTVFYADHTNNIAFNTSLDNACTTNGAGGGSGTGNLSDDVFGTLYIVYTSPDLNAMIGGNLLPDVDNFYNLGSTSNRIKDVHVGGRLNVGKVTDAGPMTATAGTVGDIVFNTSNSKFYGCTVTGSPATWAAFH